MKKLIYILFLFLPLLCFAQTTTYDNPNIFGSYTIVANQQYPTYNGPLNNYHTTYNVSYSNGEYSGTAMQGAAKAPSSGSASATVDGVTVTVTYTVEAELFGIWLWVVTYTYPDGHTETVHMQGTKGQVTNEARDEAYEKAKELAEEQAHATPIGDISAILVIVVCSMYGLSKKFQHT